MANDGTFKSMKDEISSALIDITRATGKIAAEDLAFQRSINPAVAPQLAKQNKRLLRIIRDLTKNAIAGTDIQPPQLSDADAIEERWQGLVDVFDSLLEKADACLDEYTGVIKKFTVSQEAAPANHASSSRKPYAAKNFRSQIIPKPQLLFERVPTNDEDTPFRPLLRSKPHSIEPLNDSIHLEAVESGREQYDTQFYLSPQNFHTPIKELINAHIRYGHPYSAEIQASSYPDFVYQSSPPIPFLPLESTAVTFVDTLDGVNLMLQELKAAKEIAVDLEHHDTHSYIGLTSLMQISTRDKDWVVDTLKPWREELQILNEVFADPTILKVLHGAFMDMIWLQRDLGLYVVGLFDTFHASRELGYPKNSLAALLQRHANFDAAKQYQMADWRLRPLPEEMFNYARSDTHFLLYVYDILRNELLERSDASSPDGSLINHVLVKSKGETLQRYERPFYDAQRGMGSSGWFNLLKWTPALFSREQFAVFRAVHQWRDVVARNEDENVNVIMSKNAMYNVAREMPTDMAALFGCSHPVSPPARPRAAELLELIGKARAEGATGPDLRETMQAMDPYHQTAEKATVPSTQTSLVVAERLLPPALVSHNNMPSRSVSSIFWGPTVQGHSSQRHLTQGQKPSESLRLALPLPQLTAEVYANQDTGFNNAANSGQVDPGARAEHAYVKDRKPQEQDVFIVKNVGGPKKRKASPIDEPPEPVSPNGLTATEINGYEVGHEEMEISLDGTSEEQAAREKAERKAERKAQKKAEKQRRKLDEQQRVNGHTKGQSKVDDEPFDYENAPSVLHAKKGDNAAAGSQKIFDPYSKSLNAPKGMRRAQKPTAGKSSTFKS